MLIICTLVLKKKLLLKQPQNGRQNSSETLSERIFWGSMPPDSPRWAVAHSITVVIKHLSPPSHFYYPFSTLNLYSGSSNFSAHNTHKWLITSIVILCSHYTYLAAMNMPYLHFQSKILLINYNGFFLHFKM